MLYFMASSFVMLPRKGDSVLRCSELPKTQNARSLWVRKSSERQLLFRRATPATYT